MISMATQPKTFYTQQEYLELEQKADYKSEYYKGEIFAMAGGNLLHDLISTQLHSMLARHLEGKQCRWHTSDMQVLVVPGVMVAYPDLSATCEKAQYAGEHRDILLNPTLVVEILSPRTEAYDRGKKGRLYREMPSLQELLLISQDSYDVELYRRLPDGTWNLANTKGLDSSVELSSIGYTLHLAELYAKVVAESEGPA